MAPPFPFFTLAPQCSHPGKGCGFQGELGTSRREGIPFDIFTLSFSSCFAAVRVQPRTSKMLGRCSPIHTHPPIPFVSCLICFEMGFKLPRLCLNSFCSTDRPSIWDPPASAYRGAGLQACIIRSGKEGFYFIIFFLFVSLLQKGRA